MDKIYLGDTVYAEFDGNGIILTTELWAVQNGPPPSNTIYLEPKVFRALNEYVIGLKRKYGQTKSKE